MMKTKFKSIRISKESPSEQHFIINIYICNKNGEFELIIILLYIKN